MATYNGELYIKNQIYSLLQQTETRWTLWVRDDGSSDETLNIINEFISLDNRIILISDDKGNLGPGKSFLELTKYANSEYVVFCDQDDIWFEKKLECLFIEAKSKFDNATPCLVYCNGYGYSNSSGTITQHEIMNLHASSLNEFLFFNSGYQGCSILFNRALCDFVKDYKASYFYLHDDVVSLIAHSFGKVFYIDKRLMLYRQHDFNVTGNMANNFSDRVRRVLNRSVPVISKKHFYEKKCFFEAYESLLTADDKNVFLAYLNFPDYGFFKKIFILFKFNFSIAGNRTLLYMKLILQKLIF